MPAICNWCDEEIQEGETGAIEDVHRECGIRMVMGSVAHLNKLCGCFVVGSEEGDDPGVTIREAARQAARLNENHIVSFRRRHWPDPEC